MKSARLPDLLLLTLLWIGAIGWWIGVWLTIPGRVGNGSSQSATFIVIMAVYAPLPTLFLMARYRPNRKERAKRFERAKERLAKRTLGGATLPE